MSNAGSVLEFKLCCEILLLLNIADNYGSWIEQSSVPCSVNAYGRPIKCIVLWVCTVGKIAQDVGML